ncbi:MAG UNVERIFIED_CONTAM: hypothetical protein LVT10_09815 [Anaerolineae bacterium]
MVSSFTGYPCASDTRALQFNPASAQPIDPGSVELSTKQTQPYSVIIDEPDLQ